MEKVCQCYGGFGEQRYMQKEEEKKKTNDTMILKDS